MVRRKNDLQTWRVFISSPGDVVAERKVAFQVLSNLREDPLVADRFEIRTIAWDHGAVGPALTATAAPQLTINQQMELPSDCDVVVFILAERIGTPLASNCGLKSDGSQFLSGTEWEFHNALDAWERTGLPTILVYRKLPLDEIPIDTADRQERCRQRGLVNSFFETFHNSDGSIRRGYVTYTQEAELAIRLEADLRKVISRTLARKYSKHIRGVLTATILTLAIGSTMLLISYIIYCVVNSESKLHVNPGVEIPIPKELMSEGI